VAFPHALLGIPGTGILILEGVRTLRVRALLSVLLLLLAPLEAGAFGKNKIQYHQEPWLYLQSEHFDVYFPEGSEVLAEFTAEVAESAYLDLAANWQFKLHDRVPFVIYPSHNRFQETNVSSDVPGEAVGGFTEFLKSRIVIPFQGSYSEFRHVIHHELTHAVMLQLMYGSGMGSAIYGLARNPLPMWLVEGLAEWESLGWDSRSDMFMRDAVVFGYLPSIQELSGFLYYKGGQSFLRYVANRYGRQKVGEILWRMKEERNSQRGLGRSLKMSMEDLDKRWRKALRQEYWPEMGRRQEAGELADRLTDHRKWGSFVQCSPALSPGGDRVAFLSDRSGYFDIYVASTTGIGKPRKVLSGQRSSDLEQLHWLQPGMSWSPDGRRLAFAAKSGDQDALHLLDVEDGKIANTFKLGLDGLFSPGFSPDGKRVVFVGLCNGFSDLYVLDLETEEVTQLTDDLYSDRYPVWSPTGEWIAFASGRGDSLPPSVVGDMTGLGQGQLDLYLISPDGGNARRLSATNADEDSPCWSPDGEWIGFVSDANGIFNVYVTPSAEWDPRALTDVLTGIEQVTWARGADRVAFCAFQNAGYDIFLLRGVGEKAENSGGEPLEPTKFCESRRVPPSQRHDAPELMLAHNQYSHFVFDDRFRRGEVATSVREDSLSSDILPYKASDGSLRTKRYRASFSADYVAALAGYNYPRGLSGYTYLAFSDMLGNHRMYVGLNLVYSITDSDILFSYSYLGRRTDVAGGLYHFAFYLWTDEGWLRVRNYGVVGQLWYPFSRFRRLELGVDYFAIDREYLDNDEPGGRQWELVGSASLVHDTSIPGWTAPRAGTRYVLTARGNPDFGEGTSFYTVRADARTYLRLGKEETLALRFTGGASAGQTPQRFFLGGMSNWINYRYAGEVSAVDVEDYFFASVVTPLRGAVYYEQVGTRFALLNMELRFPMVRELRLGFPLPLRLRHLEGDWFIDAGSAWSGDDFNATKKDEAGRRRLDDLLVGLGMGMRVNLGLFLLRYDVAWATDAHSFSKPRHYWALGADF
jgi:WD40 repeat protein